MAASWAFLTVGLGALVVVMLLVTPRRTGPQVWPAWELVLSSQAQGRRRYEDYEADLADELTGLQATLRLARRESEQDDWDETVRALDVASRYVARHVPTLQMRLQTWRDAARALSAICPLPRLPLLAFHVWQLRGAAAGEGFVRLTLDAAHQFALRIHFLFFGLRVVTRGFAARATPMRAEPAEIGRRLRQLDLLGADLRTLHIASLAVYKALLVSIHKGERSHSAAR